ncbi:MAG: electron transport complex subunit RsxB [Methylobacter sp.]|nr:MAG: electron transport complex subunit RsxB [Methylobacter sp.]PPD04971.1 MAG: electron transport complex subunit RsxB [Methylobacter sp.]PPD19626.1 MAG: electron transport complex subunit RsxB [Methylobacter sp.]PPD31965.1 MAG: electron transport complex subunit RsxB [Methylomonas sp.]
MYVLSAILSLTVLGLILGLLLGIAARYLKVESSPIVDEIEALMPGSQCGQCGFPGCRPAAEAVVEGKAPATLCPPGGSALAEQIATLLGLDLDLSDVKEPEHIVARVLEATCIGCTRCFKVCPTDAIVGAPKQIHAVVADACIGCKKCVEVCPTECLQMHQIEVTLRNWRWSKPAVAVAGGATC